jgi:hypothetical protein
MFAFFALLGLLFIGLKLTRHIDWSWSLVLAPIWMPIALAFFAGLFVGMSGV